MTATDSTAPAHGGFISLEFDLNHSPSKVWRALTDPVLLTEWLLPVAGFKLELGAAFTFRAQPQHAWIAGSSWSKRKGSSVGGGLSATSTPS